MKTVLEWYCKEINYLTINYKIGNIDENEYLIKQVEIYNQANEMFEQQIIDARDALFNGTAEEYYKETFKSE